VVRGFVGGMLLLAPKRKNPPEGGFFGGSRDFENLLWNLVWCRHQESNPGPTDYKEGALKIKINRLEISFLRGVALESAIYVSP
jgi:hypothetical protein